MVSDAEPEQSNVLIQGKERIRTAHVGTPERSCALTNARDAAKAARVAWKRIFNLLLSEKVRGVAKVNEGMFQADVISKG